MKKYYTYYFFILSLLFLPSVILYGQPAIDKNNMDLSVKPGEDFFRYVNGKWVKNSEIPPDMTRYGAFDELRENNLNQLKVIVEEASSDKNLVEGTNRQKIGDLFASGMDEAKLNLLGISPLKNELDMIKSARTKEDIVKLIAYLHTYRSYPFFYVTAGQDDKNSVMVITNLGQAGKGLPDRDYYLVENDRMNKIREAYIRHIANMFILAGYNESDAESKSNSVFNLERSLAEISFSRLELQEPEKNYNKMPLPELSSLTPDFNWKLYFKEIGLSDPGDINVSQKSFFEGLNSVFSNTPVDDFKSYLEWNLLRSSAGLLNDDFSEESFSFYGKFLSGAKENRPRWKRVLDVVNGSLGEALGELYVKKHFPPEAKQRVLDLVGNIRIALKERIMNLKWMSDKTKEQAIAKLEKISVKMGYPDKWRDYSKLEIKRESYYENVKGARNWSFRDNLERIGKPVDRTRWGMSPQTVNAYYSSNMNEIVFPAGILQPPFFFADADDAVNYGGIGVVIGHEIIHGFDDNGRKFDKDGNMSDWWTEEDAKKYEELTQVLVDQFDNFYVLDTNHVDGKLTLGENISDLGGLSIALTALKKAWEKNPPAKEIDGFTPIQRYFLSYGQIWRGKIRDKELLRRLKEDTHSPSVARVNGIVYNVPDFYDAFGVNSGDKMFIAPENRAVIW